MNNDVSFFLSQPGLMTYIFGKCTRSRLRGCVVFLWQLYEVENKLYQKISAKIHDSCMQMAKQNFKIYEAENSLTYNLFVL